VGLFLSHLRLLVSGPEGREDESQRFADYESGKRRRYELLFAVNGGAFALVTWLVKEGRALPGEAGRSSIGIGGLEQHHIGLGMAAFVAIMCLDLFAFGLKFRAFFGLPGKLVIISLGTILMAGWLLAGNALGLVAAPLFLPAAPPFALLAPLLAAVLMALVACFCARPTAPRPPRVGAPD
jgi:hypothetical protein